MNKLLQAVKNSVIVADGGMGTMVAELAPGPVECVEALNLSDPELILDIHKQFIAAGALLIETNTFDAHRFALARHGLEGKVAEINLAAVEIARKATRPGIFIAGSVGPIFEPGQDEGIQSLRDAVIEQITSLEEGGVDCIILETYPSLGMLLGVLAIVKEKSSLPVIASLSPGAQSATFEGATVQDAFARLARGGADIVGLNCGHGIKAIGDALDSAFFSDTPVSAMPNAGLPERQAGRLLYGVSEEYFAEKALAFARAGARIIGGCCGITPSHIRAASERLKKERIVRRLHKRETVTPSKEDEGAFSDGAFLAAIKHTLHPVICEIDPPAKLSIEKNLDAIKKAHEAGADAISMAENPLATVKVSNLAFASRVKAETGARIVMHITGRDHNTLGLQSLMLGAHVLGIEALLCVTGDPSYHASGTSNVFDVDSIGLVRMASGLNSGKKYWGDDAGGKTDLSVGVAFNPNVGDYSIQLRRLKKKIEAGARFVMTQPMFDEAKIEEIHNATRGFGVKVFMGIFPLISRKTAEYLHNEVPGITVPEKLRSLLAKKEDPAYQRDAGLDHTRGLLASVASKVDGIYLIAPHTQPELLSQIVRFMREELKL